MKSTPSLIWLIVVGLFFPAGDTSSQSLPRTSPEKQGISSTAILAFVGAADTDINTMNSFMLLRHGAVVAEGWWTPYNAKSPHMLFSLSKSFTSTAVGLAIADGKLSLDDEVMKFFPEDVPTEPSANLKAMRIRDLLCMSAGQQTEAALGTNEPWTKTFLSHPVPFKPGTHFLYNTPATYMLSAIVQKVAGITILDFLGPRLFEPLGIESPTWETSPQGISLGGYGLSLRTEDIARFGQLYLQKGEWKGRQLVPASWVAAATTRQTSNGSNPKSDWDQGYGYQFWRCRYGQYRGDGAFGQFCVVLPDLDAVVSITGGYRNMQSVLDLVWEKLLPAMQSSPLPADGEANEKLLKKLASLTVRVPSGHSMPPLAATLSRKTYSFPANDRHLEAASFEFKPDGATLVIRTSSGESRIACGNGSWQKGRSSFVNGLDNRMVLPSVHPVAASGAWTADDTYSVKLCLYETPFYTTLVFRFNGEQVVFDSEYNVAFSSISTTLPQLVGHTQ